ncbi:MAG TPA: cytidylate kinase-like family protein [Pyrinomonadaceae bacterium]|nr:cytidylate kinase-like family protein [Pyrinomonadaceae bacterium]
MRTTITISRQLGCGGSYIGQVIATRLGIKYVDREVLRLAAEEFGCDEEAVAARRERIASFWERIFGGLTFGTPDAPYTPPPLRNFTDRELFDKQTEILKRIAHKNDCVVAGWAGVYVLPRHAGSFSVFCHAPQSFRVKRFMELYESHTKDEARAILAESDETRKQYFLAMTGHDWACAENYDLSINTSLYPLDEIAELIIQLAERKRAAVA